MDTAIFIAQLLGLFFMVIGVAMIFNPAHYQTAFRTFVKDPVMIFWAGGLNLLVGYLILRSHNEWTSDWSVLITIIGWAALLKACLLLVFPDQAKKVGRFFYDKVDNFVSYGFVALVLGVILSYYGFLA